MKKRILMFESVDDSISKMKRDFIRQGRRLEDFDIHYFYPVNAENQEKVRNRQKYDEPERKVDKMDFEKVLRRLKNVIGEFNPVYILVHFGCVYHSFPNEIMSILKEISELNPSIKFGYADRVRKGNESVEIRYTSYSIVSFDVLSRLVKVDGEYSWNLNDGGFDVNGPHTHAGHSRVYYSFGPKKK